MLDDETDLRAIERRIRAVTAVRQVVHALGALARAQLPLVTRATGETAAYLEWVDDIVSRLAGRPTAAAGTETLHVVFGPERPYCGALGRRIAELLPDDGPIGIVGHRLLQAVEAHPALAKRVLFALPGAASIDEHEAVALAVGRAVLDHAPDRTVELLYPWSADGQLAANVVLARRLGNAAFPPETFSPLTAVLDAAVYESLAGHLAIGSAHALLAETRARIDAAERAKHASDAKLAELEQSWRVARQESITSELLEVVAGHQATAVAR